MPIRRVTIEIDDSVDRAAVTNVPASLTGREPTEVERKELTGVPTYEGDIEEPELPEEAMAPTTTIGRTFSDLISEFVHDPRAMATILMFIPFVVFVVKIDALGDLWYPVITGLILNAVWFGIPLVFGLFRQHTTGGARADYD